MSMITAMDVLKHNNLNCPSQRQGGKKGSMHFFVCACVLRLTVLLCKWTGISMLWKEQSWGWREQVKISLWIISPPGPSHCPRPHTWQRQKERILLFWPKPVLLVYRLKRGKRGGIFWWKAGPLWQPSSCVPAEKIRRAEAAAVPTTCRVLSPSSLPRSLLSFSAFHHQALGDSAVQVQFRLRPHKIKEEGGKKYKKKEREKINFLSGWVKGGERSRQIHRYCILFCIRREDEVAAGSGFSRVLKKNKVPLTILQKSIQFQTYNNPHISYSSLDLPRR